MLKTQYVKESQESETLLIHELSRLKASQGEDIIRFGFGQSPFLPVPSALEELKNRVEHKEYVSVQGLEELRDAVATFHNHYDQINVTADNILIAPGSKILIYSIIASFNDADVFLVTPSWVSYEPQANLAKLPVTRIQTNFENRWRLLPSELERACEQRENKDRPIVMVFNYPGNPDGLTYTQEELEALTVVFRKYNILVISDEIYGLLNHQGNHTSLARFYPEGTIVTSGLSKWCGAGGWRLGVALLPTSLDDKLKKTMIGIASETYSCASTPVQYAAIKAYQIGSEVENYLAHQRRILRLCGTYVWQTLSDAGVNVHPSEGGFYLTLDFEPFRHVLESKGIKTSQDICQSLINTKGVAMLPGNVFGYTDNYLTTRLCFVDFDGVAAMKASEDFGLDTELPESFLQTNCPKVIDGSKRIAEWLK